VRHAVGRERLELGQAELQGVEAEHVGHGLVEMMLLPGEEVLPGRGLQPLWQLYDGTFRHEPGRRPRPGAKFLDAPALPPKDILVTHLQVEPPRSWRSKFR